MHARFQLNISSNGYTFWSDTFSVFVYPIDIREADDKMKIPSEFVLHQNYPNPFNPNTIIKYTIENKANVNLVVYDLLGREAKHS